MSSPCGAGGRVQSTENGPHHGILRFDRICPGRYFALDVLWLTIANILATFSIEKAVDDDGNVIEPVDEFVSGFGR